MKENKSLVEVLRIEMTPNGEVPVFGFSTYGWSKPSLFEKGKIKSGIYKDPFDCGTTRMKQSITKTGEGEEAFVIRDMHQMWECPIEIVGLNKSIATKLRNKFDSKCNKRLAKYKVKTERSQIIGEEWYRGISIEDIKSLRLNVWSEILEEYNSKPVQKKLQKIKARGLQPSAINLIVAAVEKCINRFKGIAPTGFGKTVVAFLSIVRLIEQNMAKNRIIIMTTPNQFLANKNAGSFNDYAERNQVKNLVNIPVFSGSDIGFTSNDISAIERKEALASIIRGRLNDDPKNVIVLHTCSHSMQLVDEVLDSIGISNVDLAILDEAHTLASTKDSRINYVLTDKLVQINHRFFLTATEKNLVNPDMLGENQYFNFMNNEEVFGDYIFEWSFAHGVAEGHIVPMVAKIFEYTANNSQVSQTLRMFDSIDIPELRSLEDEDGNALLFDKKAARTITSVMSILGKEDRNKVLVLCSRNSHVTLLKKVFEAIKGYTSHLQGVDIHDIKACEYTPSERQDILDEIHDCENKSIIITGPWAITGVDCPSIDSIFWNFTPGNEISVAQGTGRGTRTYAGKENVLVCFNLDLDKPLNILRTAISSTVLKLYEAQFPSHDVELKERVRRIVGRNFLSVEKDREGDIPSSTRINLDEIYNAAESHDFRSVLDGLYGNRLDSQDVFENQIMPLVIDYIRNETEDLVIGKVNLGKVVSFDEIKDYVSGGNIPLEHINIVWVRNPNNRNRFILDQIWNQIKDEYGINFSQGGKIMSRGKVFKEWCIQNIDIIENFKNAFLKFNEEVKSSKFKENLCVKMSLAKGITREVISEYGTDIQKLKTCVKSHKDIWKESLYNLYVKPSMIDERSVDYEKFKELFQLYEGPLLNGTPGSRSKDFKAYCSENELRIVMRDRKEYFKSNSKSLQSAQIAYSKTKLKKETNIYNSIKLSGWFTIEDVMKEYTFLGRANKPMKADNVKIYLSNKRYFDSKIIKISVPGNGGARKMVFRKKKGALN